MEPVSWIPVYLMAMVTDEPEWWHVYLKRLENEGDPMMTLKPRAAKKFVEDVEGKPCPAYWDATGVWRCSDRPTMFRALHWFMDDLPDSRCAELRLYGFSFEDPEHPVNLDFRVDTPEKNRKLTMRWDKFTRPKSRTPDEWVYT